MKTGYRLLAFLVILVTMLFSVQTLANEPGSADEPVSAKQSIEANTSDHADQNEQLRTLYLGFNLGIADAHPRISSQEPGPFTGSNQFSSNIGLFVEKRVTELFHVLVIAELERSSRLVASEVKQSESDSLFIGAGTTIGYVNRHRAPFLSLIVGHTKLDIGNTGDPNASGRLVRFYA